MFNGYHSFRLAGKGGRLEETTSDIALAAILPALELLDPGTFGNDTVARRVCIQPTTIAQLTRASVLLFIFKWLIN
jgi:hypothetical protein